jgi:hypothetical protein
MSIRIASRYGRKSVVTMTERAGDTTDILPGSVVGDVTIQALGVYTPGTSPSYAPSTEGCSVLDAPPATRATGEAAKQVALHVPGTT